MVASGLDPCNSDEVEYRRKAAVYVEHLSEPISIVPYVVSR